MPRPRPPAARPPRRAARTGRAHVALLAALVAATSCGAAQDASGGGSSQVSGGGASSRELVGAPVPLTLDRADGRPLPLSGYVGRAVLVVAVLMDDLGSQATLRNAEQLARAHAEDLAVVAVVGDRHTYSRLRQLADVYRGVLGLTRTEVVLADDEVRAGRSPLGEIARVPTLFLVNRAGRIARRVEGYQSAAQLSALVAPALPPRVGAPAPAPAAPAPAAPPTAAGP